MAAENLPTTPGPWFVEADIRTREPHFWSEAEKGLEEYLAGWNIRNDKEEIVGTEGIIPGLNAEGDARLMAASPELFAALVFLLKRDEQNTCQHEETHRGGLIWEICDLCGAKWADDEGGKPEWKDPPEWVAARQAIEKAQLGSPEKSREDMDQPIAVTALECDCGEDNSEALPVVKTWAWKRACKRAHYDPDGPMTSATKRILLLVAQLIEEHEREPYTMADLIGEAIEKGAEEAFRSGGSVSWPGSRMIGRFAMSKMLAADEQIKQFLKQEIEE